MMPLKSTSEPAEASWAQLRERRVVPRPLHPDFCQGLPLDVIDMEARIAANPQLVFTPQTNGLLPLHSACSALHLECVRSLLEAGADPFKNDKANDKSPLFYCTIYNNNADDWPDASFAVAQVLLSPLYRYKGRVPPGLAYWAGHMMHLSPSLYFDVMEMINRGWNRILALLLESKELPPNVREFIPDTLERNTPIIAAFEASNLDAVKLFLVHGGVVRTYLRKGHFRIPLACHIAKICFNEEGPFVIRVVRLLRSLGINMLAGEDGSCLDIVVSRQAGFGSDVVEAVRDLVSSPMSLKEMCRLVLLKKLRERYEETLPCLEIPRELSFFLRFCDI